MKQIVIHGATNGSNFGDILFARIFYNACAALPDMKVNFLETRLLGEGCGDFLRKDLDYKGKMSVKDWFRMDTFILMSGGYFGDDKKGFKQSIKRWYRYFLAARIMQILGKDIYILGVGGGPIFSSFLRREAVKLINGARYVSFRDEETRQYFAEYGVTKDVTVTSDTAQILCPEKIDVSPKIKALCNSIQKPRIILLHLIPNKESDNTINELIIPIINKFLKNHEEYGVICCFDGYFSDVSPSDTLAYKQICTENKASYDYCSSIELCELIKSVDFVITFKLHVGIVGASFSKSVASFPFHREKVERYYRQIGEIGRCKHINKYSSKEFEYVIERYYDKPIILDHEIREKALQNIAVIKEMI